MAREIQKPRAQPPSPSLPHPPSYRCRRPVSRNLAPKASFVHPCRTHRRYRSKFRRSPVNLAAVFTSFSHSLTLASHAALAYRRSAGIQKPRAQPPSPSLPQAHRHTGEWPVSRNLAPNLLLWILYHVTRLRHHRRALPPFLSWLVCRLGSMASGTVCDPVSMARVTGTPWRFCADTLVDMSVGGY